VQLPDFSKEQSTEKRRPPLAGRPFISGREKTASASVMLADNLRANAANRQQAVHGGAQWSHSAAPSRGSSKFHGLGVANLAYASPARLQQIALSIVHASAETKVGKRTNNRFDLNLNDG
jgi:hypothetical protein